MKKKRPNPKPTLALLVHCVAELQRQIDEIYAEVRRLKYAGDE
jgi:hypothetical protein